MISRFYAIFRSNRQHSGDGFFAEITVDWVSKLFIKLYFSLSVIIFLPLNLNLNFRFSFRLSLTISYILKYDLKELNKSLQYTSNSRYYSQIYTGYT